MQVPSQFDPCWERILTGQVRVEMNFLAAKMLLVRLQMGIVRGDVKLADAVRQFRALLTANAGLLKVQEDVQRLAGKGAAP